MVATGEGKGGRKQAPAGAAVTQQDPQPAPGAHLISGFRPLARGMSRRKCLATRSVRPLLMK